MPGSKIKVRIPYYLQKERETIARTIAMMLGVAVIRMMDWGDELEFELRVDRPVWEVQEEIARLASRVGMPYTIE